jgi:hypothetical protein
MITNETLRIKDDNTFQVVNASVNNSHSVEWRRSFNLIGFEVESPKIEYVYAVNEIDHFATGNHDSIEPASFAVLPSVSRRITLNFVVPQEKLPDKIYYAEETDKGSGIFQVNRTKGAIRFVLNGREPIEQREPFANGAYPGLAFRTSSQFSDESLHVEVGLPLQQIEEIAAQLKLGQSNVIYIVLAIQSFSSSLDDALRDSDDPKELFIHGSSTPAAIVSLRLQRSKFRQETQNNVNSEDQPSEIVRDVPAVAELSYGHLLKGIRTALWAIAALLLLWIFK